MAELLKNVQGELERTQSKTGRQEAANIDSLILLDRSVDMVTPLSSQLTYEGLIDETYGIKYSNTPPPFLPSFCPVLMSHFLPCFATFLFLSLSFSRYVWF